MQIKTAHKNSNRYVYSFGTNVYGELGRPTSSGLLAHLPERVECDAFTFVALAASRHCSVAITEDGNVLAWGRAAALAGLEGRWLSPHLLTLPIRVVQLALGVFHALIVAHDGLVYSLGDGRHGKLGQGNTENCYSPKPVALPPSQSVVQVAVGKQHSLILTGNGNVYAFGQGMLGALGTSSCEDQHKPVCVEALKRVVYIAAGYRQSFAIDKDGQTYSFGAYGPWLGHSSQTRGQSRLPRSANEKRNISGNPRRIDSTSHLKIRSIAVGKGHTLLLTDSGRVYGMGKNRSGCLGLSKQHKQVWEAVLINALSDMIIEFVGAGERHSVAVSDSGAIYAFGRGHSAGLHKGTTAHDRVMRPLAGTGSGIRPLHVAVGHGHTLAIFPSPLVAKSGSAESAEEDLDLPLVDPRLEDMLRNLNLSKEGEMLVRDSKVSVEMLKHLNKEDMQEMGFPLSVRLAIFNYIKSLKESQTRTVKATISPQDLSFVTKLGSGAFGDVWQGRLRGTTTVAIKSVRSVDKTAFLAEAQIMANLPAHPNVVTFFGLSEGPDGLYIVTEFMQDGSLDKHLIQNRDKISTEKLIQMTKELAAGMDHLTIHGIIHRDLATRNLLLEIKRSDIYRVKVADFGLSKLSTDEVLQPLKTIPARWTAIEVLQGEPYTVKSDVWSFGVTVWEIFSYGALPYSGLTGLETIEAVQRGSVLERPAACPEELYNQIILPCFRPNPDERPTFREIYHKLEEFFQTTLSESLSSITPSSSVSSSFSAEDIAPTGPAVFLMPYTYSSVSLRPPRPSSSSESGEGESSAGGSSTNKQLDSATDLSMSFGSDSSLMPYCVETIFPSPSASASNDNLSESTDITSRSDEAKPPPLGRRRMGIADIDPYQLQLLSESVGGFVEEPVQNQLPPPASLSTVSSGRKESKGRNKESKGRNKESKGRNKESKGTLCRAKCK